MRILGSSRTPQPPLEAETRALKQELKPSKPLRSDKISDKISEKTSDKVSDNVSRCPVILTPFSLHAGSSRSPRARCRKAPWKSVGGEFGVLAERRRFFEPGRRREPPPSGSI